MPYIFFLLLLVIACHPTDSNKAIGTNKMDSLDLVSIQEIPVRQLTMEDIYYNKDLVSFGHYGVGTNGMFFRDKKCTIFFTDMCVYEFDCQLKNNQIILLWSYEIDCLIPNEIEQTAAQQNYPLANQAIGAFRFSSNNTMYFTAFDPVQLHALNPAFPIADTLFPANWILQQPRAEERYLDWW